MTHSDSSPKASADSKEVHPAPSDDMPLDPTRQTLYDMICRELEAFVLALSDDEAENMLRRVSLPAHERASGKRSAFLDSAERKSRGKTPTLRDAVQLRAYRAIDRLIDVLPEQYLFEALTAPTDLESLVMIIQGGSPELPPVQENPLAGAMALAVLHKQELLKQAGPLLTTTEVQRLLGISRQAVDKRRERGGLLAIKIGKNWLYPQLQFDMAGDVRVYPALLKVLKVHEVDSPWVVLDALNAADPAFGGKRMMEIVRSGRDDLIDLYTRQCQGDGFI